MNKNPSATPSEPPSESGRFNVVLEKIDRGISFITLLATFLVFFVWVFFALQGVIGPRSRWWLVAGPIALIGLLVIGQMLLEGAGQILEVPWVKTAVRLVAILRNALASVALIGLAQTISQATSAGGNQQAAQAVQFLWRLVSGDPG